MSSCGNVGREGRIDMYDAPSAERRAGRPGQSAQAQARRAGTTQKRINASCQLLERPRAAGDQARGRAGQLEWPRCSPLLARARQACTASTARERQIKAAAARAAATMTAMSSAGGSASRSDARSADAAAQDAHWWREQAAQKAGRVQEAAV